MNIKDELVAYHKARENLGKLFGDAPMWYNIIDHTDQPWSEDGKDISWDYCGNEDEDRELQYSIEIYGTSRWEKDGFVLIAAYDGSGNRDMYLFDNNNKVEI